MSRSPHNRTRVYNTLAGSRWRRRAARAALAVAAFPLLQGACVDMAQRSLINGLFTGATPYLVQRLADHLGVGGDTEQEAGESVR